MNLVSETAAWFADPAHWTGHSGIPARVGQHVLVTIAVTFIAAAIAIPLGSWLGHVRWGERSIMTITNGSRALPTLGLLTLLALWLGIGLPAPVIALVILAIPSVLAAAYSGIVAISPDIIDAAKAMGHTGGQTLRRVELPIAMPVIAGGIQTAVLQVIATATIAAYVADVGLGRYIFAGLKSRDYAEMTAGSVLVLLLALLIPAGAALTRIIHRMIARNGEPS